jgi:hypothetical protein
LIARKCGIDGTSSFWPYSGVIAPQRGLICIFAGHNEQPVHVPIAVERQHIDSFALFLTYYYRGWIDHIHSWSDGQASSHTVVAPRAFSIPKTGSVQEVLELFDTHECTWQGLELEIEVSAGVETLEIAFVDFDDVSHVAAYNTSLRGRPGWEIQAFTGNKQKLYLYLADEKNAVAKSKLGSLPQAGFLFKEIQVKAGGQSGAEITLSSIAPFDITRAMIKRQMATLSQFNVLPAAWTSHGGLNSWVNVGRWDGTFPLERKTSNKRVVSLACSNGLQLGSTPETPAYHSDLLMKWGCNFFFGCRFPSDKDITTYQTPDGRFCYVMQSICLESDLQSHSKAPLVSSAWSHFEDLGPVIAAKLARQRTFGEGMILYTHFNLYNKESFVPQASSFRQMNEVKKLHPYTEAAFELLANCKYNLDGQRKPHERIWVCPLGTQARFLQVRRQLADHLTVKDNSVHIQPWRDEVTGQVIPDATFLSQDLHGQTFYVDSASEARVFVGAREIKNFLRNPKDFTGQESVTVVDVSHPTSIFDEVDFKDRGGRVIENGASYSFSSERPCHGTHALKVQLEKPGDGSIVFEPDRLHSFETDYLRFSYCKTNPDSRIRFEIITKDGQQYRASEGDLCGRQGWRLPPWPATDYREVILDFSQMEMPADGRKTIPRSHIRSIVFALENGKAGDSVFFDRVEFLGVRGGRPHCGQGLVLGGRLHPARDGQAVCLETADGRRETVTSRGGWYFFTGVPVDAVVEIYHTRDGTRLHPIQGRLVQAVKNDVELHILSDGVH